MYDIVDIFTMAFTSIDGLALFGLTPFPHFIFLGIGIGLSLMRKKWSYFLWSIVASVIYFVIALIVAASMMPTGFL